MENLFEVRNLSKKFKDFTLADISFSLPKGAILGILGPNGAGKTTTLKLIMNMLKADGGSVSIFGLSYPGEEKKIKEGIGFVGEEQAFYSDKTVAWMGSYVASFYKNWDRNRYQRLLMEFGVSPTKQVGHLSKGQKVKFALTLALSHNPNLAILDEPTAGLDPIVRREVLEILKSFTKEGLEKNMIQI